jgi:hypothetical protein
MPIRPKNGLPTGAHPALIMAAATILLLLSPCVASAQTASFNPGVLARQRAALYVRATHTALADLESDLNHLALLSESCRAEYGSKACALPEKSLRSDKLEERYAYYVKSAVEARWDRRQVKVSRQNWDAPNAPASK